jgi:flagellar protein FlaH
MNGEAAAVEGYISTENYELDNAFGGGIPIPSLVLIEGNNDSGKTILSQQFIYGALTQGHSVTALTTESTTRSFLAQMQLLHLDVNKPFIEGRLRVIPIHVKNVTWTEYRLSKLLAMLTNFIGRDLSKVFVIDSLTYMFAEARIDDILTFYSRLKKLTEPNLPEVAATKVVIGTLHVSFHGDASEPVLVRIRSLCDAHIKLSKDVAQGQVVRSIEVAKLKGSKLMANKITRFEIHPAFGVRVVPTSEALA